MRNRDQNPNLPAIAKKDLLPSEKREHLALVIDHSGSMSTIWQGDKSRQQAAYEATIAQLSVSSDDRTIFTLIGFDHEISLRCTAADSFSAMAVAAFQPNGGTDMALGMRVALSKGIDRMVLLADGGTNREEALGQAHKAKELGVKIDTIGIGDAGDLMREIAEMTGGIYSQPKTPQELISRFVQLETSNRLMLEHQS